MPFTPLFSLVYLYRLFLVPLVPNHHSFLVYLHLRENKFGNKVRYNLTLFFISGISSLLSVDRKRHYTILVPGVLVPLADFSHNGTDGIGI